MVCGIAANRLVFAQGLGWSLQALRWALPSGVSRALPEKLLLKHGVSACQKPPALAGGVVTRAASRAVNWSRFALLGSSTILAAVVANTLVYFIGSALIGYDPEFIVLADVFGPILFTLVPASVAVLLYVALLRFADNPARTFTFISAVV